jgi:hypothetical protein
LQQMVLNSGVLLTGSGTRCGGKITHKKIWAKD